MATDFDNGKAYLMQTDGVAGTSVYDHLSSLIAKLLSEKPANAINILESLSYEIRADRFAAESNLHEQPESSDAVLLAQTQEALLKRQTDVPEDDDEAQQVVPNLPALAQHFEGADIGLGQEETFRIFLALKKLTEEQPLKSVSFWGKPTEPSPPPPHACPVRTRVVAGPTHCWGLFPCHGCRAGKILGTEANYLVAEAEFREGEEPQAEETVGPCSPVLPRRTAWALFVLITLLDLADSMPAGGGWGRGADHWRRGRGCRSPRQAAREQVQARAHPAFRGLWPRGQQEGLFCLQRTYVVGGPATASGGMPAHVGPSCARACLCDPAAAGQVWTLLPHVTPKQLAVARQIRKLFSGRLDAAVVSYPPFPGSEAELLRTQIDRITAGTHVSPLGLYTFNEEENDEDEDGA
jgi:hypothetical protein